MRKLTRSIVAALVMLVVCLAAAPASAIVCTRTEGPPGDETTVTIEIVSPLDGAVIPPSAACGQNLLITGNWSIESPPPLYDFYIIIDASGSTSSDSGTDVDGDGLFGENPDDTIYSAEIAAAQAFVNALDPSNSRVAVIRFQTTSELSQPLTSNFLAVQSTLARMKTTLPGGGTNYVPAMRTMEAECIANGDRVNREQICLFLSDGVPNESLAATDAEAAVVAALPCKMHTFALGPGATSVALANMASITGGTYTELTNPGDIVDVLPSFVPDPPHELTSHNDASGTSGTGNTDDASGTFQAIVFLIPGVNRIVLTLAATGVTPVSVDCEITVDLPKGFTAVAGPAQTLCEGMPLQLDATASTLTSCPSPIYRWVDCNGTEVCPPSPSAICNLASCAGCGDFTLEITCAGETCVTSAITPVACNKLPLIGPSATPGCGPTANLACGGDAAYTYWWDLDPAVDADSDGDAGNDQDLAGCDVPVAFPAAGSYRVTANGRDDLTLCSTRQELLLQVLDAPAARNIDGGVCPNVMANFSCGVPDASSTYWWDFDGATDSDGNGDPTDDADANGCDASTSWPSDGTHLVSGWQQDALGCRWLIAQGLMDVNGGAIPGETPDLRVSHAGGAVALSWGSVPGTSTHRALRGTIDSLWDLRLYDHAADDSVSRGACDTGGLTTFTDPDDAADANDYYYLITAVTACGGEGPTGFGWDGRGPTIRPARLTTAFCP